MNLQKRIIISVVTLLLAITFLTGCGGNDMRPEKELEKFSNIVEETNLDELDLTIYYIDPTILTRYPLNVDNLINYNSINKIVIKGSELKEHIYLFKQLNNVNLKPIKRKSRLNARFYYMFETEKEGKILDVAMWGENNSVFVNGIEVKWNDVFYDIVVSSLTEEAKKALESYLGI